MSAEIIKERDNLKNQLIELCKMHSKDNKLNFYMKSYTVNFGFGEKKKNIFIRKQLKSQETNSRLKNIDLEIFSKESCVVFVSLMDPLGTIKHA